jgi:hypothetical protein
MRKIITTMAVALGIGGVASVNQDTTLLDKANESIKYQEVRTKTVKFTPARVKGATRAFKEIEAAEGVLSNVELHMLKDEFKNKYQMTPKDFSNQYISNEKANTNTNTIGLTNTINPEIKKVSKLSRSL